ncbi:egl nine-like 3 isoform X1 [Thraustotheca clavata]|uniref:Egl nine-like 3 isoform X1 n=1 Tax=Thraustotheca clavata TaxID=74557 RepID=A0A1W0A6I8_9STRA|nr:egl nine-like 3 isoform X1 [Thraustotheca clavata]
MESIVPGTKGFRLLDDIPFACTIVNIMYENKAPVAWTIEYADDKNTEVITDFDELVVEIESKQILLLGDVIRDIAKYLTPWENATTCRWINRACRNILSHPQHWITLNLANPPRGIRISRYLHYIIHLTLIEDASVKKVLRSVNLNGLQITDRDVGLLLKQCPNIEYLGLAGCFKLSYDLFPTLKTIPLTLHTLDLYMTPIMQWEITPLKNTSGELVQILPSCLVPLRLPSILLEAAIIVKDEEAYPPVWFLSTFVLDEYEEENMWSNKLTFLWTYSSLPVFYHESNTYAFQSPQVMNCWLLASSKFTKNILQPREPKKLPEKSVDAIDFQAQKVFASLNELKSSLEAQVNELTNAVEAAKIEHQVAKNEYEIAQQRRTDVEKQVNRAVLALSLGEAQVEPPNRSGKILNLAGDDKLPLLPSPAVIQDISRALDQQYFAVYDDFLGHIHAMQLYEEVVYFYHSDQSPFHFEQGALAGGKTGRNLRYEMPSVRGDHVLWLEGTEVNCPISIAATLRQLDRLVLERLAAINSELQRCSLIRHRVMITCYPGQGSSYVKHCDNPNGNGRKLTAIFYLNPQWEEEDGGELQIHRLDHSITRIPPIFDRLVLFFSNERVPHQVAPSYAKRFALTVWYMDWDEYMDAQVFTDQTADIHERTRIEKEIDKFHSQSEP